MVASARIAARSPLITASVLAHNAQHYSKPGSLGHFDRRTGLCYVRRTSMSSPSCPLDPSVPKVQCDRAELNTLGSQFGPSALNSARSVWTQAKVGRSWDQTPPQRVSNSAYHAVSMRVISTEMRRRSDCGALAWPLQQLRTRERIISSLSRRC